MTLRREGAVATLNVHVRTGWNGLNRAAEKRQLQTMQCWTGKPQPIRWLLLAANIPIKRASCENGKKYKERGASNL